MDRMVLRSKIGGDGVLHLDLPVGVKDADREVQVTVELMPPAPMSQEEWRAFITRTAGSITDPLFRRWEQGEYEEREPLA